MRLPPVVVVAPDLTRAPSVFGDLLVELAPCSRQVAVCARLAGRRIRRADLVADILDAMGRVGVNRVTRAVESGDLTLLVPFLLTDDVSDLIVFEAQWLAFEGCEDLLAVAQVSRVRLWLVLGEPPEPALKELLAEQLQPWWPLDRAAATWRRRAARRPQPRDAVATRVRAAGSTPDDERRAVADALRDKGRSREERMAMLDRRTRDSVRPASTALAMLPGGREVAPSQLRVRSLDPKGATLRTPSGVVPVPPALRRALLRQRLHAQVVGQQPGQQLLTFDGSVSSAGALEGLVYPFVAGKA